MRTIRVISFTKAGYILSECIAEKFSPNCEVWLYTTKDTVACEYPDALLAADGLKNWCEKVFYESDALIFIGACGIAVRTIAPFLVTKVKDPAVLVLDEKGKNVISLLSGHIGGGNELTEYLAEKLGANPVITTASDVNGRLAIDVWAKKNHLSISSMKLAKQVAACIVAERSVPFFCEGKIFGEVPKELHAVYRKEDFCTRSENPGSESDEGKENHISVAVSVHTGWDGQVLHLVPKAVVLGIGCKRGKSCDEITAQVTKVLREYQIAPESVMKIASIDIKAQEAGICTLAEKLSVPFETFSAEQLRNVPGTYEASGFVKSITGVDNVCERAAMAALMPEEQITAEFICRKTAAEGVTIALLCREWGVTFE